MSLAVVDSFGRGFTCLCVKCIDKRGDFAIRSVLGKCSLLWIAHLYTLGECKNSVQFSFEFSLVTVFICLFEVGEFGQTLAKQSGIVVSLDHSARVTCGAFIACWKLITELYFSF